MTAMLRDLLGSGPRTSRELQAALRASQPTLSRLLRAEADAVLVMGRGPATRYGLRRDLPGLGSALPVYRITAAGTASLLGVLHVLAGGFWFENQERPASSAFYDGLPWFLADMRPQGFLGRAFARRMAGLSLPERLTDWQDDHVLMALALQGVDMPGNLIVGEAALRAWSQRLPELMPLANRALSYPRLADEVMAGEVAGSSAGGEQPKFTALLEGSEPRSVIVKFSGDVGTQVGRRWADLLVAEHHALEVMRRLGRPAAESTVLSLGGRVYLEVSRFDRLGAGGREGMISLGAFDDQFVGRRRHWLDTAQALARQRLLTREAVADIAWQQAYAELIANTDRHFGNLSLGFQGVWPAGTLPAYDMLPMYDAPRSDGAVDLRPFTPALPAEVAPDIARSAIAAAVAFWQAVAGDDRVSMAYRAEASRRGDAVARLLELLA